ncbi:phage virion morphogenesis protein [Pseudomonas sp. v388]|uniref:phage virion morphogenesis protein n=1 Tax=Pseudomonas sp. v388 TaxID=2479849 RepID=UPI000F781249|nr:phage virion morphogenesis protein [Pseudomonas sp. v388]RRV04441.1 phage virion morphogenesis protein [Pseudomonas sp. v388]
MTDSLTALEEWAAPLLRQMEPGARAKLAKDLAKRLRRSQQQRITRQLNVDGTPYAPRKPRGLRGKVGRMRRKAAMFTRLKSPRFLKAKGDGEQISVGFTGRIARIARVHQYGLKDRAEPGAKAVKYARREQLGLNSDERQMIQDLLLSHLRPD